MVVVVVVVVVLVCGYADPSYIFSFFFGPFFWACVTLPF